MLAYLYKEQEAHLSEMPKMIKEKAEVSSPPPSRASRASCGKERSDRNRGRSIQWIRSQHGATQSR
eukprot:14244463-Heterocapsa_arctica.AAC.1